MRTNDARMVHKDLKKIAEEMAGAYYELAARKDNRFYKEWPLQSMFIRRNWKNFVLSARHVLTDMLASGAYSDQDKERIFDILIKDSSLPYSTQENQIVNVPH